ncbi:hypothetical protein ACFQY4_31895 [Catellatospora bangladeshensis]|uniref:hypothetical protein n=1 Tax=Catellatospora bangladeshensis TaxID=310355 RepID=UPI001942DE02|nr:hypothetical protein [Catellatospora bangladeshensis]
MKIVRIRFTGGLKRGSAAVLASLAVLLGTASPALAAEHSACIVQPLFRSCETDDIPAHSSQHWVTFAATAVSDDAAYKVIDSGNGVVVASGTIKRDAVVERTIYGLYGRYYLRLYNARPHSYGTIQNYTI